MRSLSVNSTTIWQSADPAPGPPPKPTIGAVNVAAADAGSTFTNNVHGTHSPADRAPATAADWQA